MKPHLIRYARAGYAGLFVVTAEEARAEAEIQAAAAELGRPLHVWSVTEGFADTAVGTVRDCPDPLAALDLTDALEGEAVVLLRDFGAYLEDRDPVLVRRLRDLLRRAKAGGKLVLLLGPWKALPPELEREITRLDLALPGPDELGRVLDGILDSAALVPLAAEAREAVLAAAAGLTTLEAENAFALSVVETGGVVAAVVAREKAQALRQGGLLEVVDATPDLGAIGGLEALKAWLRQRREAFTRRARDYGLPVPRGMLVLGVPGTGKSLTAKATATVFGVPLLQLDAGRLFGSLVGQSEANLRAALQTAEAIAPCVLWIDELEKAFASGGDADGGVSKRVFGTFLSWLQDRQGDVFVIATSNDIAQLPPEFIRKGRFDEVFFVDLPREPARAEIFRIHLRKRNQDPTRFDLLALAKSCDGFSGAEIEQAVVGALYGAFSAGTTLTTDLLLAEIAATRPLSGTMWEKISELREWASTRTVAAD